MEYLQMEQLHLIMVILLKHITYKSFEKEDKLLKLKEWCKELAFYRQAPGLLTKKF